MYIFANELTERGKSHMQKKNVVFTKEGMKVGVKELKTEDYEDKTQRFGILYCFLGLGEAQTRLKRRADSTAP
jgi:hypothetical protein